MSVLDITDSGINDITDGGVLGLSDGDALGITNTAGGPLDITNPAPEV